MLTVFEWRFCRNRLNKGRECENASIIAACSQLDFSYPSPAWI